MRCVSLPRALMMMIGTYRAIARALAHLQPVHAGQHHVQHQRIPRAVLLEQAQAGIAAGGMGDVEPSSPRCMRSRSAMWASSSTISTRLVDIGSSGPVGRLAALWRGTAADTSRKIESCVRIR